MLLQFSTNLMSSVGELVMPVPQGSKPLTSKTVEMMRPLVTSE